MSSPGVNQKTRPILFSPQDRASLHGPPYAEEQTGVLGQVPTTRRPRVNYSDYSTTLSLILPTCNAFTTALYHPIHFVTITYTTT